MRDFRSSWMLRSFDWSLFTDVSGQSTYRSHPQGSSSPSLNMGTIYCPESSVNNYQSQLRNIPEERTLIYTAPEAWFHA
jgi:hypothetical protein